jgi:hypothetical protein
MSAAMKGHRMVSAPAVMCFFQELLTLESSSYLTCLANAPPIHRDLVLLLLHTRNRPRNSIGHHISGVVLGKFHFKLWEGF